MMMMMTAIHLSVTCHHAHTLTALTIETLSESGESDAQPAFESLNLALGTTACASLVIVAAAAGYCGGGRWHVATAGCCSEYPTEAGDLLT